MPVPAVEQRERIQSALPAVRAIFGSFMQDLHIPGLVFGIVAGGELVAIEAFGERELEQHAPVAPDTIFRIASMSKSFVAMAILKLRDAKQLKLDDPVTKYLPEFKRVQLATADSPAITLRHLLTMTPGFPEDNPWGDRQMAVDARTFGRWLESGIPFSQAPGVQYEYSNYGYSILGRIIRAVTGKSFQDYTTREILVPLGMRDTVWDKRRVPPERLAQGYKWEEAAPGAEFVFKPEPILADGAFAAMAGLFTTVPDFARYMLFLLSAFPPRNDADAGPVKRSTLREMQQLMRFEELVTFKSEAGREWRATNGYGFGLAVWHDERFGYGVSHGGGLPGYGSYYYLLPDCGIGIVALTNRTYGRVGRKFPQVLDVLETAGALMPRSIAAAPVLLELYGVVNRWLQGGADKELVSSAADNFFLDRSLELRRFDRDTLMRELGHVTGASDLTLSNALRGKWRITGEQGWLDVFLTLAPTMPPRIQALTLTPGKPEAPA